MDAIEWKREQAIGHGTLTTQTTLHGAASLPRRHRRRPCDTRPLSNVDFFLCFNISSEKWTQLANDRVPLTIPMKSNRFGIEERPVWLVNQIGPGL